jgi:type IV secretion system protein VirB9
MKHTLLLTSALLLCLTSPAIGAQNTNSGSADARVKTITYHEMEVFRITGHYGFSTVLEFEQSENIETIALGDSQAWQTIKPGRGNLLFIKPLEKNAATNMSVVTNKRIYTFELTAKTAPSAKSEDLSFRIRFDYPEQTDLRLANIGSSSSKPYNSSQSATSDISPEDWNFEYSYSGNKNLRPTRAFDDGVFTYLQFNKTEITPAVFSVDENGNEAIVNYTMRGNYMVIEKLSVKFILRDGDDTTYVLSDRFAQKKPDLLSINQLKESGITIKSASSSHYNN